MKILFNTLAFYVLNAIVVAVISLYFLSPLLSSDPSQLIVNFMSTNFVMYIIVFSIWLIIASYLASKFKISFFKVVKN